MVDAFIKEQWKDLPELNDEFLIASYLKSRSVQSRLKTVKTALVEAGLTHTQSHKLATKILVPFLIPAGTKSTIRGCRFNEIISAEIKTCLSKLKMRGVKYDREKKHDMFHEIPDWIIVRNGKTLVGYNQISLFGGGHQINRGSKYVLDDALHRKLARMRIKMVCIVKDLPVTQRGKATEILQKGIKAKRIYCIRGIKKLIHEYFCA